VALDVLVHEGYHAVVAVALEIVKLQHRGVVAIGEGVLQVKGFVNIQGAV
jgi:hypothetical protein